MLNWNRIDYSMKMEETPRAVDKKLLVNNNLDASIYGNAVRMSQSFSYRYPLIDTHGNNGSLMHNNDYAADRYLEMRSGKIADEMTKLLPKETIDKWKLNYTEEEEYPTYLPTTFPNLLTNGNFGIAVSLASSIPPHNLNDVSNALITMIDNKNYTFEDIYCPIDFPTGGIVINEKEVKESLKTGHGKAAIIRSCIDYDSNTNELIVRELPYMIFSANATESIQKAIDDGLIAGINSVYDGTDYDGIKIVIELNKNANVEKITKLLFKHTLLQSSFSINMNALEDGKIPKLFNWEELLKSYLNHLDNIIRKSFEFDLRQLKARLHILEGLIIAILNIEEVVDLIKKSETGTAAKNKLIEKFHLSSEQTDAILALKLSRLANLELKKIENEKKEKEEEKERIEHILSNKEDFNNEIKKEIIRIQNEYGDSRRTKNISLEFSKEDEEEPIEQKELLIHFTNLGNFFTQESTTLLTTRRGGKGAKIKLNDNEAITQTISDDNMGTLLAFTNKGQMYSIATDDLPINSKINASQLFELQSGEKITSLTTLSRRDAIDYFVFITKNGLIKKTAAKEYEKKRGKSIKAINLKDDDEVVAVHFIKNEPIGILTSQGNFVIINTEDINSIGRATAGIKAVKLNEDDMVICSQIITGKFLITISSCGLVKKASLDEFPICNRGIKGKKISGTRENDEIIKFLTLSEDCDIIIISKDKTLKFNTSDLRILSREATGVKAMKLSDDAKIVNLIKA